MAGRLFNVPTEWCVEVSTERVSTFVFKSSIVVANTEGTHPDPFSWPRPRSPPHPLTLTLYSPDCDPPAPFFGACCLNGRWRSNLPETVFLPEYVLSKTPVEIEGNLAFTSTQMALQDAVINVQHLANFSHMNLNLNSSSLVADRTSPFFTLPIPTSPSILCS